MFPMFSSSRKRSVSPSHGRDIKRKIDIEPVNQRNNDTTTTSTFEYRKRVIISHNLPGNHSGKLSRLRWMKW